MDFFRRARTPSIFFFSFRQARNCAGLMGSTGGFGVGSGRGGGAERRAERRDLLVVEVVEVVVPSLVTE